jgi:hypothetical protein
MLNVNLLSITPNVSGLCVVALIKNLKLTTTLDRATQNPCYVPLNLETKCSIYSRKKQSGKY